MSIVSRQPTCGRVPPDPAQGLVFKIKPEYQTHRLGFGLIYEQSVIAQVVAQRRGAAHPHAFLLGSGDLVADAFAGNFAFKLGKRQKHV